MDFGSFGTFVSNLSYGFTVWIVVLVVVDVEWSIRADVVTVRVLKKPHIRFFQPLPVVALVAVAWCHDEVVHRTATLNGDGNLWRVERRIPRSWILKAGYTPYHVFSILFDDVLVGRKLFIQIRSFARATEEQDEDKGHDCMPYDDEINGASEADCIIQYARRWRSHKGAKSKYRRPETRHQSICFQSLTETMLNGCLECVWECGN